MPTFDWHRILVGSLLLTMLMTAGCGYRAPLSASFPPVAECVGCQSVRSDYQPLAALLAKDVGMEPVEGNTVALIVDPQQKLDLMLEDLRRARESVYLDVYRFYPDSSGTAIMKALEEQAASGKDVRVILDRCAHPRACKDSLKTMQPFGVDLHFFRFPAFLLDYLSYSLSTQRDHRKILMTDGTTAYLGGRNIQDCYFREWRDADLRITGPVMADIAATLNENQYRVAPDREPVQAKPDSVLRIAALRDSVPGLQQFYEKTLQIVPDSPNDRRLPIRNCFEWSIGHAQHYFWFFTPYSPPPSSTIKALKDACARGVDVRWIVPANNDVGIEKYMGESLYRELLKAGVRIYEWQDNVLHAKQFLVDDYLLAMGSANMDNLSFFLNYEVLVLVYDEEITLEAKQTYLDDLDRNCREIQLEEVLGWSFFRKMRNWFVRHLGGHMA